MDHCWFVNDRLIFFNVNLPVYDENKHILILSLSIQESEEFP